MEEKLCSINASLWSIISTSLKMTGDNFGKIFRYLLYPLFGQFIGILICFAPIVLTAGSGVNYVMTIIITLVFLVLGLGVFCHAFWRYLLVQGGLVLIGKKLVQNEEAGEFKNYTEEFAKRSKAYIKYLFIIFGLSLLVLVLFGVLYLILTPLVKDATTKVAISTGLTFLIFIIFGLFFTVCLQSFVLNPEMKPFDGIKKGIRLVANNYWKNFGFLMLIGLVSLVISIIISIMAVPLGLFMPEKLASAISDLISSLVSSFYVSPFAMIATTWWYLRMENEENKEEKEENKEI